MTASHPVLIGPMTGMLECALTAHTVIPIFNVNRLHFRPPFSLGLGALCPLGVD